MDDTVLFRETQHLSMPWISVLMGSLTVILGCVFGFGLYRQLVLGIPFGTRRLSNGGLVIACALGFAPLLAIDYVVFVASMKTEVRRSGVKVDYPFTSEPHRFDAREIQGAFARTYDPANRGRALVVTGNRAVEVRLANGQRVLIGSKQPEALAMAIARMREMAGAEPEPGRP